MTNEDKDELKQLIREALIDPDFLKASAKAFVNQPARRLIYHYEKQPPRIADAKVGAIDVEDCLEKSSLHVNTWWSGEGFTLFIDRDKNNQQQSIDITWQQWEAMKLLVKSLAKSVDR